MGEQEQDKRDAKAWLECRMNRSPFLELASFLRLIDGLAEPTAERVRRIDAIARQMVRDDPTIKQRISAKAAEILGAMP